MFKTGALSGDINSDKISNFQSNVSGVSAPAKDGFYL